MSIVRSACLICLPLLFLAGCCSTCPQGEEENGESSELEFALINGFSYDTLNLETYEVNAPPEDGLEVYPEAILSGIDADPVVSNSPPTATDTIIR
ncbi:MAG TPA: hypothetical protein ENH10_04180 [Bacteroidetes bacterium]|nr:hypothetical protein BMS3Bbin04_00626 [bacterium BMS3Bbin04]HDO65217.1 hypothetical protein [Bacteroidota bacterium]HEX04342.1 hypothetical protein [Bacteroidota bacterium]